MALETFNYLNSLVATNPVVSDGLVNGDDHIRGIKLALLNTFPNISGAVTATQGALNAVAGWATSGVNLLAHGGAFFDNGSGAPSTDGFQNNLAGDIDVVLQGTVAATFQRTVGVNTLKVFGGFTATGEIKGPGITPIGAAVMWFDDTLPTDGLWVWANGQIISNANTVAPVLLARWGSRFGGNGTTTMGVPNMQEVVPVGKSGMGGATAPGLLTTVATGIKDVLLALFGTETVTLTAGQIPTITASNNNTVGLSVTSAGNVDIGVAFFGASSGGNTIATVNGQSQITSSGNISVGAIATSSLNTGGQAHNNLGPRRVVNWIIRIG